MESVIDLYVSQIPIGSRMAEDSHIPVYGFRALSLANCSPDMERIYQARKNNTEITVGIPSPPFRIMAPRGAPMKKKIRQAMERVNFRWISIWYLRSRVVFELELLSEVEMKFMVARAWERADWRVCYFCRLDCSLNRLSRFSLLKMKS